VGEKERGERWWAGERNWAARGPEVERAGGIGLGFFSFSFFFQIHFKPISNPFKIKSFTCFQIQILTQISPTILKAFHKPFFNNFSNIF
jgi:hypothetical protein